MHSGLTTLVLQPWTIKMIQEGHGFVTGPVEPRTGVGDSKLPVHPCHSCTAITTRMERRRFSSATLLSCSGGTACFYLSSLAGSDATRSRTEEQGSRSASARQVAETGLSPRRLAGFLEATTEGFVLHKSPPRVRVDGFDWIADACPHQPALASSSWSPAGPRA